MAWARFRKKDMPGGLWNKCSACNAMFYQKDVDAKGKVCPECGHHFNMSSADRIAHTLDPGSFEEMHAEIQTVDHLEFTVKEPYTEKIAATVSKTGINEAMVIGTGKLRGRNIVMGVLDFRFLGGSMGSVVGEKVTLAIEEAMHRKWPLVLFASSGGARMHEGALSLMQMAKTCAALGRFSEMGGLYIAVLCNPTTGGVTASWATQADVVLAEPGALIGFAGPRVIQNTLRQELPDGFQRSEFLLKRGQIDRIVQREELPNTLAELIHYLTPDETDFSVMPTKQVEEEAAAEEAPAEEAEAAPPEKPSRKGGKSGKKEGKAKPKTKKPKAKQAKAQEAQQEQA